MSPRTYTVEDAIGGRIAQAFEDDGFVFLNGALDVGHLEEFEDLLRFWADKIIRRLGLDPESLSIYERLQAIEKNDPKAFFQLCSQAGTSVAAFAIAAAPRMQTVIDAVWGEPANRLFCTNLTVFWNDPSTPRLHYEWHQEASYQTTYRTGFHTWFPLFRDLEDDDGPMIARRASHRKIFPYDFHRETQGVTQLSISPEALEEYETVRCSLKRGDMILFHHALVHATGENRSGLPRVSGIIRYFDAVSEDEFEPVLTYPPKISKDRPTT